MKKLVAITLVWVLTSCATFKSEQGFYDDINENVVGEKYNLAIWQILAFEGKYPESSKLCELWKMQESLYEKTGKVDYKYVEILKKKQEERCK